MKTDNWPTTITTTSKPSAFPSALRQKRSIGNRSAARAKAKTRTKAGNTNKDDDGGSDVEDGDEDDDDDDDDEDDDDGDEEDLAAEAWPSTREPCPACDNPELLFKAVQLRSADEGTTIFYRCGRCGHRLVLFIILFLFIFYFLRLL